MVRIKKDYPVGYYKEADDQACFPEQTSLSLFSGKSFSATTICKMSVMLSVRH